MSEKLFIVGPRAKELVPRSRYCAVRQGVEDIEYVPWTNPVETDFGASFREALKEDVALMLDCHGVLAVNGYAHDPRAMMLVRIARACGLPIFNTHMRLRFPVYSDAFSAQKKSQAHWTTTTR